MRVDGTEQRIYTRHWPTKAATCTTTTSSATTRWSTKKILRHNHSGEENENLDSFSSSTDIRWRLFLVHKFTIPSYWSSYESRLPPEPNDTPPPSSSFSRWRHSCLIYIHTHIHIWPGSGVAMLEARRRERERRNAERNLTAGNGYVEVDPSGRYGRVSFLMLISKILNPFCFLCFFASLFN